MKKRVPTILQLPNTSKKLIGQKQPRRPHYLADWLKVREMTRVQFIEKVQADKGHVSKWMKGTTPGLEWQPKIAAVLDIDPADIFSDPNDVWFRQFLRGRPDDEVQRIKTTLEAGFPRIVQK
jgi:hypothetical protein